MGKKHCFQPAAYLLAIQPLHSNRVQKQAATCSARARAGRVRAANIPAGVEVPKVQPRLSEPFLGFTKTTKVDIFCKTNIQNSLVGGAGYICGTGKAFGGRGLQLAADAAPTGPTIIKFDRNELSRVGGPKDAARMLLVGLFTLLVVVGQLILQFMRTHRIKINLRILASKKLLAALMLYAVFTVARNVLS